MDVIVVAMLVLPPVLVGIVGWCAARIGARHDHCSNLRLDTQRVGYRRLSGEREQPAGEDRRAA